ncbi:MAG TPA: hypothetical protein VGQ62_00320 [Chloroflexota bacterium]|nr:hypothetical protein [Chloroflexota bacterium]
MSGPLQLVIAQPVLIDGRVIALPLVFGFGLYLLLTAQPFGRPKPDLGDRLRRLDVDERMRLVDLGRRTARPLFASRLLENMLRPVIEDAGRLLRTVLLRLGLAGGRELELSLRVLRPGVEVVQFLGEKVASGLIAAATFPGMTCSTSIHLEPGRCGSGWLLSASVSCCLTGSCSDGRTADAVWC